MRLRWLLIALALSLLLLGVHLYALEHYLYWEYRWFDTPVHFLGGMMMGTALVGVLLRFRPYTYMIGIAAGALGWEFFEYHFGITSSKPAYIWDSQHDVLNDVLGAIVIYIIARYTIWRSR